MHNAPEDITGQTFGPLLALEPAPTGMFSGGKRWDCKCVHCGTRRYVRRQKLLKTRKFCFAHGETGTPLYLAWVYMKTWHNRPVDRAWSQCFRTFRRWAIVNGYREGAKLRRHDPIWEYKPSNCYWEFNGSPVQVMTGAVTRQRSPKP
jgi:hypothetical protein